jgi:hypothetical protein
MEQSSLGLDILFENKINPIQARNVIAKAFDIGISEVMIEQNFTSGFINDKIKVLAYLSLAQGEFAQLMSIFIRDSSLSINDKQLAQSLSSYLNNACLISDDEINPYTMLEIYPNGIIHNVILNPDDLDNNIYIVMRKE